MKIIAAVVTLSIAVAVAPASGATIMRIGSSGTDYASVSSSKKISGKKIGRSTVLRITASGTAEVEGFQFDDSFNKVSQGITAATPEVTGSYSINCFRSATADFESIDGTLRGGTTTRRIPLMRPTSCRFYVRVSASTSATYPNEARSTFVTASVTTARR